MKHWYVRDVLTRDVWTVTGSPHPLSARRVKDGHRKAGGPPGVPDGPHVWLVISPPVFR
jgi:hypothetical protein